MSFEITQAAYLISQAAAAMIEAMGMMAENQKWMSAQDPGFQYLADDFMALIDKYGLHHNDTITTLRGE